MCRHIIFYVDRRTFLKILAGVSLSGLGIYYLLTNYVKPVPTLDISDIEYDEEVVAKDLIVPWSIEVLEEDVYLVSERPGRLTLVNHGVETVVKEFSVAVVGEAGLLGLAKHPDFDGGRRYVYQYLSYHRGGTIVNKVVRFRLSKDFRNVDYIEDVLDDIPGASIHDGGRIRFGPDGLLYICTGDANIPNLSQDIQSLAGKILRVYDDGSPVEDNPFDNHVYSYGHRNPQGLDWNPYNNVLISNEHGPVGHDEINEIVAGGNYGWPIVAGYSDDERFIPPIFETGQDTIAPSGASFIDGRILGFNDPIYVIACLRGRQLFLFNPSDASIYSLFRGIYGRLRDVKYLGDSKIIFSTSNRDGRGVPMEGDDRLVEIVFK